MKIFFKQTIRFIKKSSCRECDFYYSDIGTSMGRKCKETEPKGNGGKNCLGCVIGWESRNGIETMRV